jgi:hypothetical protein
MAWLTIQPNEWRSKMRTEARELDFRIVELLGDSFEYNRIQQFVKKL